MIDSMDKKPTQAPVRLLSLDALRGFDMFWITGGEEIFHVLAKTTGWAGAVFMADQFTHPSWNGFRIYDLIFPLFLFLAGVSTPFSLGSRIEKGDAKHKLLRKVIQRGLILVLLGVVYNNGILHRTWAEMRYPSVLGRIGLAGMFAQIIYLYASVRTNQRLVWWFGGILVAYWLMMILVPVPNCGAGVLTIDCNLASWIDRTVLPGHLHRVIHDPEGLLSTFPAVATALLGIMAGNVLRQDDRLAPPRQKITQLLTAGVCLLAIGQIWGLFFPINKNLWTSSFVCWVGGLSLLLLTLFYWVIDVRKSQRWTLFFVVIGTNSILIYLAQHVVSFEYSADVLFGGIISSLPEYARAVSTVVAYIAVQWAVFYVLYRNKIFLKV